MSEDILGYPIGQSLVRQVEERVSVPVASLAQGLRGALWQAIGPCDPRTLADTSLPARCMFTCCKAHAEGSDSAVVETALREVLDLLKSVGVPVR